MSLEENWENLFHGLKKERLDTRKLKKQVELAARKEHKKVWKTFKHPVMKVCKEFARSAGGEVWLEDKHTQQYLSSPWSPGQYFHRYEFSFNEVRSGYSSFWVIITTEYKYGNNLDDSWVKSYLYFKLCEGETPPRCIPINELTEQLLATKFIEIYKRMK